MAGVKGRSGGARPGAGRPQTPLQFSEVKSVPAEALTHKDPKGFLLSLMNNDEADLKLRIEAAKALMPFLHAKVGETGKKEQKQEAAERTASGRFGLRAVS